MDPNINIIFPENVFPNALCLTMLKFVLLSMYCDIFNEFHNHPLVTHPPGVNSLHIN